MPKLSISGDFSLEEASYEVLIARAYPEDRVVRARREFDERKDSLVLTELQDDAGEAGEHGV